MTQARYRYPCSTDGCPGDGRYVPPGRGHIEGCGYLGGLEETPVRVCCGQRHQGPVCPDGLVMCQLCFKRVTKDRLHVLEEGSGVDASSAPIYSDVCKTCKQREDRWGSR